MFVGGWRLLWYCLDESLKRRKIIADGAITKPAKFIRHVRLQSAFVPGHELGTENTSRESSIKLLFFKEGGAM